MAEVLNGVDVFVASVQTGSFAAAAKRLHLTRSAVAKTIGRIEARLDARLFHRTTRSLTLTEDGQIYYERCLRALEELRAGVAALESGRREAAGRLRVSVPVLFGRRCVAPVLARLTADHPKLELNLSFNDRPLDLIEDGFDLAIRNGSIGNGTGLMTRTVGSERMTVCAGPAYLDRHGRPASFEALTSHWAVAYGRTGHVRPWQFPAADGGLTEATPPSRLRFDDLEAIADAAEAGHGLAWVPHWLVRDRLRAGTLVPVLDHLPQLVFQTHALWPAGSHLPLRVRLALDALATALPGRTET